MEDVLRAHVEVDLRRRQVVVAEHLLESRKGHSLPDRVHGEGVAQHKPIVWKERWSYGASRTARTETGNVFTVLKGPPLTKFTRQALSGLVMNVEELQ